MGTDALAAVCTFRIVHKFEAILIREKGLERVRRQRQRLSYEFKKVFTQLGQSADVRFDGGAK